MAEADGSAAVPDERGFRAPGPDYSIRIVPHKGRVVVHAEDLVLADSEHAVVLYEANLPSVVYFPREDVDMARLQPSEMSTFSPYKGNCTYYALDEGETTSIAWSYESAPESVAGIRGFLAFLPDRVDIIGLRAQDEADGDGDRRPPQSAA